MSVLFFLLWGHVLADYPLQGPFLAAAKNRHTPAGQKPAGMWIHALTAHALIHGGFVYLVTGSLLLGCLETFSHWLIDFGKCENWYGIHIDQLLHIGCKLLWWVLLVAVL
jgi:hypothetical protein